MIDSPPLLTVKDLHKEFGEHTVLGGVDLLVPRGSMVSLLGRSGAGKSVLLKCLAGLLRPDAGVIQFEEETSQDFRRRCSYLFQANALFDSLTAFENVALPLEQTTRLRPTEVKDAVMSALKNLGLEKFADYFPAQLSGGMTCTRGSARLSSRQRRLRSAVPTPPGISGEVDHFCAIRLHHLLKGA